MLSVQTRIKIQTTVSQNYLLGGCALCAQTENLRRCGRDALNNTSCECVVAKANEADCLANAEVQTREEGGSFILVYTHYTFVEEEQPREEGGNFNF